MNENILYRVTYTAAQWVQVSNLISIAARRARAEADEGASSPEERAYRQSRADILTAADVATDRDAERAPAEAFEPFVQAAE